jgi:hypothetical protein
MITFQDLDGYAGLPLTGHCYSWRLIFTTSDLTFQSGLDGGRGSYPNTTNSITEFDWVERPHTFVGLVIPEEAARPELPRRPAQRERLRNHHLARTAVLFSSCGPGLRRTAAGPLFSSTVSGTLFGATQISYAEPPQGAVYEIAPE